MPQAAFAATATRSPALEASTPYIATLGRLLLAAIFLLSGFGKLTAAAGTIGYIQAAGLPAPAVAYAIAVAVELIGGVMLVLGYQARLVAAALAGFSLVTAFAFHGNFADQNQMIHFLKNVAIAGGMLQIVAFGAGSFSLDGKRVAA